MAEMSELDCPCPPQGETGLGSQDIDAVILAAKALGDPVRLRIVLHVAQAGEGTVCACHMPERFGVSQPTLSHHLKKLTQAGLLSREVKGRWAHYRIRPAGLAALHALLTVLTASSTQPVKE